MIKQSSSNRMIDDGQPTASREGNLWIIIGSVVLKTKLSLASIGKTRHTNSPVRRESPDISNDGHQTNRSVVKKTTNSIVIS